MERNNKQQNIMARYKATIHMTDGTSKVQIIFANNAEAAESEVDAGDIMKVKNIEIELA